MESCKQGMIIWDVQKINFLKDRITWDAMKVDIVDYLLNDLQLDDLFDEEEIQKCIGIIRINGISSTDNQGPG